MSIDAQALRAIGPKPPGEPAAMRAVAAQVSAAAQQVGAAGGRVARGEVSGRAPVVTASNRATALQARGLQSAADALNAAAAAHLAAAGELEARQAAWQRRLGAKRGELLDEQRRAAL